MQIGGEHQHRGSFAQLAQIGAGGQAQAGRPFPTAHFRVEEGFALHGLVEFFQEIKVFVGKASPGEGDHFFPGGLEILGHQLQGFLPGGLDELVAVFDQRFEDAFGGFAVMVTKATLVADPELVNRFILPRQHALDHGMAFTFGFAAYAVTDVAADRALRADRGDVFHLPGTCSEAEIRRGQCAHRTNIGGVTREDRIETGLRVGHDLQLAASLVETDDRVAGHLVAEAHAARALDAAFAVEIDQLTQRNVLGQVILFVEEKTALSRPIGHGLVLQRAFAALVANRTIQRMRGEQEFDDVLAGCRHLFTGAPHHHPLGDRSRAGGIQLGAESDLGGAIFVKNRLAGRPVHGGTADIHQAHAAHPHRFHLGVVAKDRNGDARHLGSIHDQRPCRDGDGPPIDL